MVSRFALKSHRLSQILALCLAYSLVCGCTVTTVPISSNPEEIINTVNRGDTVSIITSGGQHLRFSIDDISNTGLIGGGKSVQYSEIRKIDIEEKRLSKAGAWIIGGAIGLALSWGIWQLIDSATEPDFD